MKNLNQYRLPLLSFLFLFNITLLFSQQEIRLINADSIVGYKIGDQNVRDFIGNVQLRQGNIILHCNKAVHFLERNDVELIGNVQIEQDVMVLRSENIEYIGNQRLAKSKSKVFIKDTSALLSALWGEYDANTRVATFVKNVTFSEKKFNLKCEYLLYDRNNQIVSAFNNVVYSDDSVAIDCDTLFYDRKNNIYTLIGNVNIVSRISNIRILAGFVENRRNEDYSFAKDNPLAIIVDTLKESVVTNDTSYEKIDFDTLFVFCDSLYSKGKADAQEFYFDGNVKIFKSRISAIGGEGYLSRQNNIGYLKDEPFFWYDSTEFRGRVIYLHLKENKIEYVGLSNDARILTPSPSWSNLINVIESDSLNIVFKDGEISKVFGSGKSKTVYFFEDENRALNLSIFTSDSIRVDFVNREIDNVVWLGTVYGEVVPESIFENNINKFYAPPNDYYSKKPILVFELKRNVFGKKLLN